ncbi:hypothetical protein [Devosia ginsengisoli]|uniref:hypothetical protein n=1 Tax=Devosia ginsengisoli TaxID=400770 RepID=UPI0026ED379D|nr:hypothetical protein [Devosia ginsengisoli]MCR6672276.1 hypothetical protein [Devosia ginsengisoli]
MTGWEIAGLVVPVVLLVALVTGLIWHRQWKRDPERFKAGFRNLTRGFHNSGSGRR